MTSPLTFLPGDNGDGSSLRAPLRAPLAAAADAADMIALAPPRRASSAMGATRRVRFALGDLTNRAVAPADEQNNSVARAGFAHGLRVFTPTVIHRRKIAAVTLTSGAGAWPAVAKLSPADGVRPRPQAAMAVAMAA